MLFLERVSDSPVRHSLGPPRTESVGCADQVTTQSYRSQRSTDGSARSSRSHVRFVWGRFSKLGLFENRRNIDSSQADYNTLITSLNCRNITTVLAVTKRLFELLFTIHICRNRFSCLFCCQPTKRAQKCRERRRGNR